MTAVGFGPEDEVGGIDGVGGQGWESAAEGLKAFPGNAGCEGGGVVLVGVDLVEAAIFPGIIGWLVNDVGESCLVSFLGGSVGESRADWLREEQKVRVLVPGILSKVRLRVIGDRTRS